YQFLLFEIFFDCSVRCPRVGIKSGILYIGLKEFLGYYQADYLRYYLISINPYSQDDLNFDWDDFAVRINSELIGNLGNLVNRALGFTKKSFDGILPAPDAYDEKDKEAEEKIKNLSSDLYALLEQNHLDRALKKIMDFSGFFNQYFQHKEPWKKGPGTNTCVYLSVNAVCSIAVALYPFLPQSAEKIWRQLGLPGEAKNTPWKSISEISLKPLHKLGDVSPIFAKVEDADIKKHKEKFETK
ncbi:MAG: class I tRNA ligase family protein, partial [Nitrososphaerota archaeon]